jgi:hypothetical protein
LVIAIVVAIVAVVVVLVTTSGGSTKKSSAAVNWTAPSGVKVYGALGPEGVPLEVGPELGPPNTGLTSAGVDGITCTPSEQLAYHIHVHLAIFINGQPRSVPVATGMVAPAQVVQESSGAYYAEGSSCLYWLHVHAQDGIVHIESPEAKTLELGQFFDIWHQTLSSAQIGQYKGTVTATVNGKPWTNSPTLIPLISHSQIVLNLGGPVVTPPPISWSGTSL